MGGGRQGKVCARCIRYRCAPVLTPMILKQGILKQTLILLAIKSGNPKLELKSNVKIPQ